MLGLLPVIVLGLVFMAFCYYQLARYPAKALPKWAWAIVILIACPLGGIIYLAVERLREEDRRPPASRAGHAT